MKNSKRDGRMFSAILVWARTSAELLSTDGNVHHEGMRGETEARLDIHRGNVGTGSARWRIPEGKGRPSL